LLKHNIECLDDYITENVLELATEVLKAEHAVVKDYNKRIGHGGMLKEFASPIVLVKKRTGEIRLCIDY